MINITTVLLPLTIKEHLGFQGDTESHAHALDKEMSLVHWYLKHRAVRPSQTSAQDVAGRAWCNGPKNRIC